MINQQSRMGNFGQLQNPNLMNGIGAEEAPGLNPKTFINPDPMNGAGRVGGGEPDPNGGVAGPTGLPIGGVSLPQQPLPTGGQLPQQPQEGGLPQPQGAQPQQGQQQEGQQPPMPTGPRPPMGNMLNITRQGKEMGAMKPPNMKEGGAVKHSHEIIHIKTGKVIGKFKSLKEAKVHHAGMDKSEEHAIQPVKPMTKSVDIMKIELLNNKGKR